MVRGSCVCKEAGAATPLALTLWTGAPAHWLCSDRPASQSGSVALAELPGNPFLWPLLGSPWDGMTFSYTTSLFTQFQSFHEGSRERLVVAFLEEDTAFSGGDLCKWAGRQEHVSSASTVRALLLPSWGFLGKKG